MPIAVQAVPFLAGLAILALVCGWAFGPWAASPGLVLFGFVAFFFRDPERTSPPGDELILSPADGRVTAVEHRPEGARVSIFLSLFNCHINRAPVTGSVLSVEHTPGRFRPAWDPRVDRENERNHLVIRSETGTYGVTQIAGIAARVQRGERIGLIQFGSRTDLYLPPGIEPAVRVGERVRGAISVLARQAGGKDA
jgi:phosphatidylserine decarboxylase